MVPQASLKIVPFWFTSAKIYKKNSMKCFTPELIAKAKTLKSVEELLKLADGNGIEL